MDELFAGAHPHLLFNHAPILGAVFALALLAASFVMGGDVLRKTALVVLVAVGIAGLIAFLSGEPAEDAIRGMPGVQRAVIHAHEELGESAFIAASVLGVLALGALLKWRRTPLPKAIAGAGLVGAAIVSGMMAYVGLLGGRIRHTEVRPGSTAADALVIEPPRRPRPPQ